MRALDPPQGRHAPLTEGVRNVRAGPNVTVGKVVEAYWRQIPDDADHPVFALAPAG